MAEKIALAQAAQNQGALRIGENEKGCSWQVAVLNQELLGWERTYNTVRPHQGLGYQTPEECFTRWRAKRKSKSVTNLLDEYN